MCHRRLRSSTGRPRSWRKIEATQVRACASSSARSFSRLLHAMQWVFTKERPHRRRRVDGVAIWPNQPLRDDWSAARPLVAFALDCVENYARAFGAVRIFALRNICGDRGWDRSRSTPVSTGPVRKEPRNAGKAAAGELRWSSVVRTYRIGGSMEGNHGHRSMVRAPTPFGVKPCRNHADRSA